MTRPHTAGTVRLGEVAPGLPVRMYPQPSPWAPWCLRVGSVAIGAALATAATILRGSPTAWWAAATTIATALLFAWTVAGHELYARRPRFAPKRP
jgi:hypothetical protein